jgi:hypothetical protein
LGSLQAAGGGTQKARLAFEVLESNDARWRGGQCTGIARC